MVSAHNVVKYLEGGGHFWVYMQGCDVWWLEAFRQSEDSRRDQERAAALSQRLGRYGMAGKLLLYTEEGTYLDKGAAEVEAIFRDTDLLLNFYQAIQPRVSASFGAQRSSISILACHRRNSGPPRCKILRL